MLYILLHNRLVILCIILTFEGCSPKTTSQSSTQTNRTVDSLVVEYEKKMNVNLEKTYNEAEDFVLITDHRSRKEKLTPKNLNNILIIRLKDNSIVFHEQIQGGVARWINLYEVEIFYPSGIPDFQKHIILNVKSGITRTKNEM